MILTKDCQPEVAMELATAMNLEPYSQDWNEFVEKCIESMLED